MKIIISHDVDHLKPSDNLGTLIIPKAIIRAGIELSIGTISFKEFNLRLKNIIKNKWQNINGLMKYDREQGVKSTYFIGVNNGLGLNYSIKDATYWIKRILRKGFDVGVHGIDYESYEAIKKEYDIFKEISGLDTFGIRMHYLRTGKETYNYLARAGYNFDASLYGLKHSFKIHNMFEFPLHIMDGYEIETNRQWQTIKEEEAIKNTIAKIERARLLNIEYLSILLHPKYFDDSFNTWQNWYKEVILYCKDQGYEFIDFRGAIKEINYQQKTKLDSAQDAIRIEKKDICHITTVHPRNDIRIFHKECKSLSKKYNVSLIVADGKGDENIDGINIIDIGLRQNSRLKRARIDSVKALRKALSLDCSLYHIHDPELTKMGVKLKERGKKVIYDTHEDLPRQIAGKPYISSYLKPIVARLVEWQENGAAKKFDYICSATPFIRDRFLKINSNTIDINNYPILGELYTPDIKKEDVFCYTGGITEERGIINIVMALKNSNLKVVLAGPVDNDNYLKRMAHLPEWENVDFRGLVDRKEVGRIMSSSIAGLVLFLPFPNHINAQPNKIFEYMSAGVPVIGSNFALWKSIIVDNNCGLCVNPEKPEEIAEAMNYLKDNPKIAQEMGENGKRTVLDVYNWANEEKKIFKVYNTMCE